MRRVSRIRRPIGLLNQQSNARIQSPYLCLACKLQTTSFSTSTSQSAPKIPYTEKIRKRIWGTDTPPGQEDPYGDASVIDQLKKGVPKQQSEVDEQPDVQLEATELEQHRREDLKDNSRYQVVQKPAEGQRGEWKWLRANPVWEPERKFRGFLPKHAVKNPKIIAAALRRALIEAYALHQAGMPLESILSHMTDVTNDWTAGAQISPSPTGATIQMSEDTSLEEVVEFIQNQVTASRESEQGELEEGEFGAEPTDAQEDIEADRSVVDPLKDEVAFSTDPVSELSELEEFGEDVDANQFERDMELGTHDVASWDPSWVEVSLEDPEIKFAVLKRTMQLTGIRLPDAGIKSSNSAKALLRHLIARPKPRELVAAIEQKGELQELGNVTIHAKKRTAIKKEKDIGRLKVIEKELEARGLAPWQSK